MTHIQLTLNGVPHRQPAPASVADVLAGLSLAGRRVAVEHNGIVVPRSQHPHIALQDGDRLEIIVAVGGG
jgi:sulfur carrier protein